MRKNIIVDSDYYKHTHGKMYAPNTTGLFSYAESRGGTYSFGILYGLQGWIMDNLLNPLTKDDVDYAEDIIGGMGGFDRAIWDRVISKHGGFLPVKIQAVKEGINVPVHNVLATVESTDRDLFHLANFIETALIRLWYPTTIATKAAVMRRGIDTLFDTYADTKASRDFPLLDFGCRGVTCYEQAAIGGGAFLTSFIGSDTCPGVVYNREFYGAKTSGFSVPATEHSVMCSYGRENEFESFKHLLENVAKQDSIISVVSDTWNIYKACEFWNSLSHVVERKNLTLVIRPDSGEFTEVLPRMISILAEKFEYTKNDKGLKVFKKIKILWADGISEENYLDVFKILPSIGWGVENLLLGSGGGLLQNVNRDTMKFAFKASAVEQNKTWYPIAKAPITDPGKKSKMGRICLVREKETNNLITVDHSLNTIYGTNMMETVYENSNLLRQQTLEEIRTLIKAG